MTTYTIEFDITEMVKLIAICNGAIISEGEFLDLFPNGSHREMTEASIAKIKSIKAKIKDAIRS